MEDLVVQDARKKRKHLKTVYMLPSLLTAGNMVCGLKSLEYTMNGDFTLAAWMIILACVFDGLDGKIARLARAQSLFGVNFDSLADLTAFGIAPALLIYRLPYLIDSRLTVFIIYAVFTAVRLARYNVQALRKEKGDFTGIPAPAAGWIMASTYLLLRWIAGNKENPGPVSDLLDIRTVYFGLHVLAVLLAILMVSRIPYPKLGYLKIEGRKPFNYFLIVVAIIAVGIQQRTPVIAVFLAGYAYLFIGLIGVFRKPKGTGQRALQGNDLDDSSPESVERVTPGDE
jgi:CDP-diacylglycerol--serine O-phosphatidyltransferase